MILNVLIQNTGLKRCGKSCRLRWTNYLRPDIKRGRFSFEEEETIIQLHSVLGNKYIFNDYYFILYICFFLLKLFYFILHICVCDRNGTKCIWYFLQRLVTYFIDSFLFQLKLIVLLFRGLWKSRADRFQLVLNYWSFPFENKKLLIFYFFFIFNSITFN